MSLPSVCVINFIQQMQFCMWIKAKAYLFLLTTSYKSWKIGLICLISNEKYKKKSIFYIF